MTPTDHIVIDVEIKNCVGENGLTWNDTDRLGVACACVWEYSSQRMRIYGPDSEGELRQRIVRADRVSGFNIDKFDLPLIFKMPNRQHPLICGYDGRKVNDIFLHVLRALGASEDATEEEIHKFHHGWSLNDICTATLGVGKIGHGAEAPRWFQQGDWARVVNYCADDVALERDLVDFVDRHGYVISGGRRLVI